MLKFQRNYKAIFEIGKRSNLTTYEPKKIIEIAYPFTCNLNISSSLRDGQITNASFQFYNLSSENQVDLWKDEWQQTKYVRLKFYAGYGNELNLIYAGDILSCTSYRESGSVDYITDMTSSDGSYLAYYGISNVTLNSGQKLPNILQTLLADTNYSIGCITDDYKPSLRPRSYCGKTWELLNQELAGYQLFLDGNKINVLKSDECVKTELIPVITDASGLLGSPRRANISQIVNLIFDPTLKMGGLAEINSTSLPWLNGVYKVMGITHSGLISPVEASTLTTTVDLLLGTTPFKELTPSTQALYQGANTDKWTRPAQGSITSSFGRRTAPKAGASTNHMGIDIGAPLNSLVVAPADGRVSGIGYDGKSGKKIYIHHGKINGKDVFSAYFHLNQQMVQANQLVSQGQQIGLVGNTGNSTGPHLHFGIKENGNWVNPLRYIK